MLIIGAKGFAKELLEVCHQLGETENLVFYDDLSNDLPEKLYSQFDILRSESEVKSYFEKGDNRFSLGLGGTALRKKMAELFVDWGGELTSLISPNARIAHYGVQLGKGATILTGAVITGDVKIGKGILMYPNAVITHGCEIGDFVELSPGATVLGNCSIGSLTQIGANATVLPKLLVGEKCIIGAGGVLTKNLNNNTVVKGIPAK